MQWFQTSHICIGCLMKLSRDFCPSISLLEHENFPRRYNWKLLLWDPHLATTLIREIELNWFSCEHIFFFEYQNPSINYINKTVMTRATMPIPPALSGETIFVITIGNLLPLLWEWMQVHRIYFVAFMRKGVCKAKPLQAPETFQRAAECKIWSLNVKLKSNVVVFVLPW